MAREYHNLPYFQDKHVSTHGLPDGIESRLAQMELTLQKLAENIHATNSRVAKIDNNLKTLGLDEFPGCVARYELPTRE